MARSNLLPWREHLREERKKQFISILVLIVLFAGLLVFLGDRNLNGKIDQQNARNDFLRKEISLLDGRIKEIEQLQARRTQLLDRMKIIQDLQGNRPIILRVDRKSTRLNSSHVKISYAVFALKKKVSNR